MEPKDSFRGEKGGQACRCGCSLRLEPVEGFQPDPANPGKFLWELKKDETGLIRIVCSLSSSSDSCFCSEDISEDRDVSSSNLTPNTHPGRIDPDVDGGGRTMTVKGTVLGKALLEVDVKELTAECRKPAPPEGPVPGPLISSDEISCGSIQQTITVIA